MKKQHIIIIAVIVVFWIGHGIIASNNRQTENTTTENQTDVRGGGTAELENHMESQKIIYSKHLGMNMFLLKMAMIYNSL